MYSLFAAAIALFAGLMMTRVFKYLHINLPDVTAFLIAGVLVGPFGLGHLGIEGLGFTSSVELDRVEFLSTMALGFIAFDIGNEFRMSQLRQNGKAATVIGIIQALAAALLVDIAMLVLHLILGPELFPLPAAITLGAIATATAPAATLMVVRQYKAHGPLTDLLLPIVALDDAVGLVVFAVSFGIAMALNGGNVSALSVILGPIVKIICSLVLGSVMGVLLSWLEKLFFSNANRLSLTISFVVMTIALSSLSFPIGTTGISICFSSLLVCMMLGTVFCNMSEYSVDIMERSSKWTVPLYAEFFVLSGAQLDLGVLKYWYVLLIGLVYIVVRCLGKYFGAGISSAMMGCGETVRKYLGITLFPQAGVALGMVVTAQQLGEYMGGLIRNIVLFSVLVYELFGPMLTHMALRKAGEIGEARSEEANRSRFPKKQKIHKKRRKTA